jgi:hypothetical protein
MSDYPLTVGTQLTSFAQHWAAANGHIDTVKCLLGYDADVNILSDNTTTPLDQVMESAAHSLFAKRVLFGKSDHAIDFQLRPDDFQPDTTAPLPKCGQCGRKAGNALPAYSCTECEGYILCDLCVWSDFWCKDRHHHLSTAWQYSNLEESYLIYMDLQFSDREESRQDNMVALLKSKGAKLAVELVYTAYESLGDESEYDAELERFLEWWSPIIATLGIDTFLDSLPEDHALELRDSIEQIRGLMGTSEETQSTVDDAELEHYSRRLLSIMDGIDINTYLTSLPNDLARELRELLQQGTESIDAFEGTDSTTDDDHDSAIPQPPPDVNTVSSLLYRPSFLTAGRLEANNSMVMRNVCAAAWQIRPRLDS